MTGSDGRPAALEQLGHAVERLVVAVCVAGSGVLGGLVLLVVFVVVVLVAADTRVLKPSAAGISELGPSPLEMSTGTPPTDRIVPGQIDGLPPATTDGGLIPGWTDRPALNQYACGNYRSATTRHQWAAADCSAAALDWLLGAYGVRLGGIDDAVALIGPGNGISTAVACWTAAVRAWPPR